MLSRWLRLLARIRQVLQVFRRLNVLLGVRVVVLELGLIEGRVGGRLIRSRWRNTFHRQQLARARKCVHLARRYLHILKVRLLLLQLRRRLVGLAVVCQLLDGLTCLPHVHGLLRNALLDDLGALVARHHLQALLDRANSRQPSAVDVRVLVPVGQGVFLR
jgi:hypothetical protein